MTKAYLGGMRFPLQWKRHSFAAVLNLCFHSSVELKCFFSKYGIRLCNGIRCILRCSWCRNLGYSLFWHRFRSFRH